MSKVTLTIEKYEDLLDKLETGTPKERVEAELELMGRLLYYTGD